MLSPLQMMYHKKKVDGRAVADSEHAVTRMRRLAYMHNLPVRMSKLKIPNSGKLSHGEQKHTNKLIKMYKLFMNINVFYCSWIKKICYIYSKFQISFRGVAIFNVIAID